jgi:hypothetical protein
MGLEGGKRKFVALAGLAVLALLAWQTMDAGPVRLLVFVVLGGFALRIALTGGRSRYDDVEEPSELATGEPRSERWGRREQSERARAACRDALESRRADVAQLVEHSLGKGEVTGSIPVISSRV